MITLILFAKHFTKQSSVTILKLPIQVKNVGNVLILVKLRYTFRPKRRFRSLNKKPLTALYIICNRRFEENQNRKNTLPSKRSVILDIGVRIHNALTFHPCHIQYSFQILHLHCKGCNYKLQVIIDKSL